MVARAETERDDLKRCELTRRQLTHQSDDPITRETLSASHRDSEKRICSAFGMYDLETMPPKPKASAGFK
jgi:hypothetical protein